jgi:hypothetical protein
LIGITKIDECTRALELAGAHLVLQSSRPRDKANLFATGDVEDRGVLAFD